MKRRLWAAVLLAAALAATARATETENLGLCIVPAPGKVVVDGKCADWNLAGGVFICSDVENLRGRIACWFHASWDQENLYVLARWVDDTPMNNPGSVAGDMGFLGDCLQFRTIVADGEAVRGGDEPKTQRTTHVTAWRDRAGKDVIDMAWGQRFDQGGMKDAKTQGGAQAFVLNPDGHGYVQEIRLPWKLVAPDGWTPAAGLKVVITVEPNFGTTAKFRISLKDLFRPGVVPDRVFTFASCQCWGLGALAAQAPAAPQQLRLADNREFKVRMEGGAPVIDWTGLYQQKKLAGFAAVKFAMPDDGYVSLNVKNAEGQVVRCLLTASFFPKGEHEVKWDGLTTSSHLRPGEVVAAGDYSWEALWHKGLGLRLVGWACNGGKAPFDSPGGNWGGDMGAPVAVTVADDAMVLGWSSAEAGQAVVCTDLEGNVRWRHKRGGFGGAALTAADGGVVFVYDVGQGNTLYRLLAAKGDYVPWQGSQDATLDVGKVLPRAPEARLSGLDAAAGKLYLSYGGRSSYGQAQTSADAVAVLDAATGVLVKTFTVRDPGDLEVGPDGQLYVIAGGSAVLRLNAATGVATPVLGDLKGAAGLAIDRDGQIFVGLGDPDHQVAVFAKDGKPLRRVGKPGGRPTLGPWDQGGLRAIAGLRVDPKGKLWVMENDWSPKRISVWRATDGKLLKEFFGPTAYGAGGGAVCPADPLVIVGHGCEWRLDPQTGRADCVAVFHRGIMANARFGFGPDRRVYLAVGGGWAPNYETCIYERLGPGQWKLRTKLMPLGKDGQPAAEVNGSAGLAVWADANDDQQAQPDEIKSYKIDLGGWISGWYMPMPQTLINYGGRYRLAPVAWTACGAPVYDPTHSKLMPGPADLGARGGMGAQRGCGSEDGRLILYNGHYGEVHSDFQCFDIETGKLKWTYPNNYTGVHGGHLAPPPQVGLIRGAYDIVGSVKLPDPVGDIFVIPTDKGEWHILSGDGFYLGALFQADPLKIRWPDPAVPGAIMDNTPPGMGAEDFGGSIAAAPDGQLYVQAGKTAFINLRVIGLDAVQPLGRGALHVSDADLKLAVGFREKLMQAAVGVRLATVGKRTVVFTGDLRRDFGVNDPIAWAKNAAVQSAIAYDETNLYLGWTVSDVTPWVNGASEPAVMYAKGDTVDFQLGADPNADRERAQPVLGDLRLSIGNFKGKPAAVLYRPVATHKNPRKFYSGTARDGWEVESVARLPDPSLKVTVDAGNKRYSIEAAIPLAVLGITPKPGLKLSGDFGVTYGNPAGDDTVLRSYWNNQATDFLADEVWELKLEPRNWGQFVFE